ncbi:hypothetical protein P171DRAFT_449400 [Karstenula rhodostoma CBS 690.94]|uniref:J domain-containing protein n=1 Tax=Karstenula rhodostoma CBS 690.94 TaxID=1392251 RepID=A0A9P4U5X7_9PLEO|nr:hypothetical protein P171DRAFT_449400 [Karstenula rhodostoma CBS 690.94]
MSSCNAIPMYDDVALLSLARETPLPEDGTTTTTPVSEHEPSTPSTAASPRSGIPMAPGILPIPRRRKRRAALADIEVLADPDTASPPPKKSARKDGRIPLGERKDHGNTCPRKSEPTPTFIPSVEDWNRFAHYFTPPPTPPTTPPKAATPRTPRTPRATGPACMILYSFLELHDWKATDEQIKSAYKKVAVRYHPDKVDEQAKADAHDNMLCINASRDVLLDKAARAKYHKDGKLPTVFSHVFPGLSPNV